MIRARLGRALTALRGRLVAMYESGSPDLVSVILASDDYDEMVSRTAYLEQIEESDEVVIGRVRDLRDEVQGTVKRLRAAKNTIESARDAIAAEEQALASARQEIQSRQSELVATRGERCRGAGEDRRDRRRPRRRRRRNPGRTRGPARRLRLGPVARRPDPRLEQRQRADLAGRRPGRLRLRNALGPDAHRRRHRRPRRHPDPRRGRGHRRPAPVGSRKRRLRELHLHRPRRRSLDLLRPPVVDRGRAAARASIRVR